MVVGNAYMVIHAPKEPNVTCDPLVRETRTRERWFTVGEEMETMSRKTKAAKRRNVPIWWMGPVFAILTVRFSLAAAKK